MSAKRWFVAVVLIGFFSQSISWSAQYKMKTIFEKGFNAEIDDVVFASYEEDGTLKFYPKIVILKHPDKDLSQGDYKFYKNEVQILDTKGSVLKDLWFPYWSLIGCSKNGNFFYVLTSIPEKSEPYDPSKIELPETKRKESSFAVYNDKGDMLWKKSPFELGYDVSPSYQISPKDGSVIGCLMNDINATSEQLYAPKGSMRIIRTMEMYEYCRFWISGAGDNWDYFLGFADKFPMERYEELPGKSSEPRVLLFDSLLNFLWERPLDEYLGDGGIMSPKGSYIYASGHTMAGVGKGIFDNLDKKQDKPKPNPSPGMVSTTGYLFDNQGNLIMKIEDGSNGYLGGFSPNEEYLLIDFNPPRTKQATKGIGLINIKAKRILFKKDFWIYHGLVASNGSVAVRRKIKPEVDSEQLKKMPVGEARRFVERLEQQAKWMIYIFDKNGNTLFEKDFDPRGGEIRWSMLNWDGGRLIIVNTDKTKNRVKILSLEFERGLK